MQTKLALARKWRPKNFSELIGQEHVVRALSNALNSNRLHHAYLFSGARGVGKTTLARILAKALNCETGITATPCGVCNACREIDEGRFMDLLELDAASHTQVDNMREILENAMYAPSAARFKVYIIDEVHMLSKSAFNAMLKTLEEPPAHVKFILATTDPAKVPVTVLSRCLQFNLKQIPAPLIVEQLRRVLQEEEVQFEPAALPWLARAAQGSMRDGLSLLDQAIAHGAGDVKEADVRTMLGAIDPGYLFSLLEALSAQDPDALIAQADTMAARNLSFDSALQDLAGILLNIALIQVAPNALADDTPERGRLTQLARAFSAEDVQLFYQIALQGRNDLGLAPDEYAGFTMTLLRMLAFTPKGDDKPAAETVRDASSSDAKLNPVEWHELSGKMRGLAKQLAQACELKSFDGHVLELAISEKDKHLLGKPNQDKLRAALEEELKARIRVNYVLSGSLENTPVERAAREKQADLDAAIELVSREPLVRKLMESCDARLVSATLKSTNRSTT
ncbi:MAG TPA: DNA polymerase III subunit gamma/tau [Burkholderiales bacterium]|nr:DNA polymerase III subunit gamma/tau [Burkholderiales bacterium]